MGGGRISDRSDADAALGRDAVVLQANSVQLQVYGSQANTLIDNAGVVQMFGPRNREMAQEFAMLAR